MLVDALVGPARFNVAHAARLAGYSSRVVAYKALTRPEVQDHLAHRLAELKLTKEWVLGQLGTVAASSMANFIKVKDGKASIDWDRAIRRGALGQIREFIEEVSPDGTIKQKIKLYDKMTALSVLAKHYKLVDSDVGGDAADSITIRVRRAPAPAVEQSATPEAIEHNDPPPTDADSGNS